MDNFFIINFIYNIDTKINMHLFFVDILFIYYIITFKYSKNNNYLHICDNIISSLNVVAKTRDKNYLQRQIFSLPLQILYDMAVNNDILVTTKFKLIFANNLVSHHFLRNWPS